LPDKLLLQSLSTETITVTDHGPDPDVDPAEKEAVLALIAKWEELSQGRLRVVPIAGVTG
jgi:hypothetical protein